MRCLPEVHCSHQMSRVKARGNREDTRRHKGTSGTKSSPSRHLSIPPAGHIFSSVHHCPFSPSSPAFASLLLLLPDIPILPSFYAVLSLWFLSPSPPPPNPRPPLPSFSSSSNRPPCLSFSSSATASRTTDSPPCLSVFFHSRVLAGAEEAADSCAGDREERKGR